MDKKDYRIDIIIKLYGVVQPPIGTQGKMERALLGNAYELMKALAKEGMPHAAGYAEANIEILKE